MNNIVIDTNPLVYIYHDVPDFGKNYAASSFLSPIPLMRPIIREDRYPFFQADQAVVTFIEAIRRKMSRLMRNNFFYGITKSFYSFDLSSALYMIIKG